ncbi:MAG: TIGR04282 family arsenosugar biosynthesis glycosyltransferase [Candidatus Kapabacteria bacterium]|jgi:hypothetical protein|nr:TIGR04282 family arsenosugar biosynthesis glycosyltransferase [Candidatus Kapabacteria bacterium]
MSSVESTAVVVFIKEPRPGYVKTRLAASVGNDAAARLYRVLVETVLDSLHGLPARIICALDRPAALHTVPDWLGRHWTYIIQQEGDLGNKLHRAVADVRQSGYRNVIIIGTDAPEVNAEIILKAQHALQTVDVVIGPAYDGGYYLIGTSRPLDHLFQDISWSTDEVLQQTLQACMKEHATVHLLEPLRDIDTADDLNNLLVSLRSSKPAIASNIENTLAAGPLS